MAVFALSDPHLALACEKPMDIFGQRWQDHTSRLAANWEETVAEEDTVVIGGDISWAMQLLEALPDLLFLHRLPGRKILMRGNHDYWWSSVRKLEQLAETHHLDSLSFLRNNAFRVGPDIICGTRGWTLPEDPDFGADDRKIYDREVGRLKLTLDAAEHIREAGDRLLVFLHYPPVGRTRAENELTRLLTERQADVCIFGHVHGESARNCFQGMLDGVSYQLASADYLGFKPLRL